MIEMPSPPPESLIFEPFIGTDEIIVSSKSTNGNAHKLMWKGQNRWVEVTVGVVGKRGAMHSLSPSITVKESGGILSLEEKFQGMIFFLCISHTCFMPNYMIPFLQNLALRGFNVLLSLSVCSCVYVYRCVLTCMVELCACLTIARSCMVGHNKRVVGISTIQTEPHTPLFTSLL